MEPEKAKTCDECDALCCKHVAMEIDAPEELEDFENLKWFVCHENVNVFVDEDNIWHIEFLTPCEHLEGNKCGIYDKRPEICREHNHDECLFHAGDAYKELYTFKKIEDVEDYIENVFKKGKHVIPEEESDEEEEDENED